MTLEERCRKIWKESNIENEKIEWLVSQLTDEAKENSDKISDTQILNAKSRLIWYGFVEAISYNLEVEDKENWR